MSTSVAVKAERYVRTSFSAMQMRTRLRSPIGAFLVGYGPVQVRYLRKNKRSSTMPADPYVRITPVPDACHDHLRTSSAQLRLLQFPRVFRERVMLLLLLRIPVTPPPLVYTAFSNFPPFSRSRRCRVRFSSSRSIRLGQ